MHTTFLGGSSAAKVVEITLPGEQGLMLYSSKMPSGFSRERGLCFPIPLSSHLAMVLKRLSVALDYSQFHEIRGLRYLPPFLTT